MKYKLAALIWALLLGFNLIPLSTVNALSGSDFQAGRIVDDNRFFNSTAMSAGDIQGFLNEKIANGACDTNGTLSYAGTTRAAYSIAHGYSPPFTCLKDYSATTPTEPAQTGLCSQYNGGSQTSAQMIAGVAQACGINPEVLLVILEKEESLVTDDWPWPIQYQSAMGFGCPDSGSCNTGYAGFFTQLYSAARQFKLYGLNPTSYGYTVSRDNYIQYNPTASCGGTTVYLQTQSTADLYNYTPYQPDAAALSNLTGTGDSCSSYGNRNFWVLYNNWFGTTTVSYADNSVYAKSACNIPGYGTDQVGRLYNPETQDFLFTTSDLEACLAMKSGYIWDGIRFQTVPATAPSAEPVYRLVNYTRHLFTTSLSVKQDYMTNRGYRDEGIAFYVTTDSGDGNIPADCYVKNDTVVYTSASGEGTLLESEGYTDVGTAFYTPQMQAPNNPARIYRLSNGPNRLYTANGQENMVAQLFYGFTWEKNSDFYAPTSPGPGLTPVYRLSAPGYHFYTDNRGERDTAVVFYSYMSEGATFYAYPTPVTGSVPVYRLNDPTGHRLYTESAVEKQLAISLFGYTDEGIAFYLMPNPS